MGRATREGADLSTFGGRLAAARALTGWSQKSLAARTGIDQAELSRMENDEQRPNIENLTKLTAVLGSSADFLLHGPAAGAMPALHDAAQQAREAPPPVSLPGPVAAEDAGAVAQRPVRAKRKRGQ